MKGKAGGAATTVGSRLARWVSVDGTTCWEWVAAPPVIGVLVETTGAASAGCVLAEAVVTAEPGAAVESVAAVEVVAAVAGRGYRRSQARLASLPELK